MRHNSPFFNVLINDKYKVRAVMDTGSTGTIISEGAYNLMNDIPMQPTSAGFSGVLQGRDQYNGILEKLRLRFSDDVTIQHNVAVVPNPDVFVLLGNDLIGGSYSKFARVHMSDPQGLLIVQDSTGASYPLQFIKNREFLELRTATHALATVPSEPQDELQKLFRR